MEITTELELLKSNQSETQVNSRSLDAQPHGDTLPAQRELGDPDFGVLVSFLAPRFITWCKLNKKKKNDFLGGGGLLVLLQLFVEQHQLQFGSDSQ